jgi:uncharacterized protein (TIGR04255 family)
LAGFAFHRLNPYETWEPFRTEARRLWELYCAAVGPVDVLRIGARYINQLAFPAGRELSEYLQVYPLTDSVSRALSGYGMNATIPIDDMEDGVLFLQQALLPPDSPEMAKLLLDIQVQFPRNNALELWDQIERIRPIKNRIFNDCITPQMKESLR